MLKIYNSLTRQTEEFVPLEKDKVKFYSCGPTVYNYVHIGNLQNYIAVDLFKRYLKYRGYEVKHVMNVTDVDDKTMRDSKKEGKTLKDFTEFYLAAFLDNFKDLNITLPDVMAKATEHIPEMVALVKKLLEKGYAYKSGGSVYFKIASFPGYGKLANIEMQELKKNADGRLNEKDEYEKEDVNDFVLWKGWKEEDGEVFWETEIGKGHPGWHIECSAISMKYLGETMDIHQGGIDLLFPHHTNEIAQSEAATGKKFSNYWMHKAHLMVEGQKMSKSLHNFFTLQDIKKKGIAPLLFKIELMKTHYRQQSNFSLAGIEEDKKTAGKFVNLLIDLDAIGDEAYSTGPGQGENDLDASALIADAREKFVAAMDDDLNIALSFSVLFDFVNEVNKQIKLLNKAQAQEIKKFILEVDSVLGFIEALYDEYKIRLGKEKRNGEVIKLLEKREQLRQEKKFQEADAIRDELLTKGIVINDTAQGWNIRLKEVV
jgi:cysteinyl-tRNA synthetase